MSPDPTTLRDWAALYIRLGEHPVRCHPSGHKKEKAPYDEDWPHRE